MIKIRRSAERGHADHGWLDTYHSFSFAEFHDPAWMGFRSLRVINDDRLAPSEGFDMHPHRDMEIISYVVEGALEHKDSMGNGRTIRPDEFQYMSAGSGILHSEFNPDAKAWGRFLQIWIMPMQRGAAPRYAERSLSGRPTGQAHLVASLEGRVGSFAIRQDADLWFAQLGNKDRLHFPVRQGRHLWLQVITGSYQVGVHALSQGDALALSEEAELALECREPGRVLVFDLA